MKEARKSLPIITDDNKIQITIEADQVVIRLFMWVETLGWQCQKTIRFDQKVLPDLQRALLAFSRKVQKDNHDEAEEKIIRFPLVPS